MFNEMARNRIIETKTSLLALYNLKMSQLRDPKLTALFKDNCIISGGAISSIMRGLPVNDIDVYAKTKSALTVISKYIPTVPENIKSAKDVYDFTGDDKLLVTPNAITLKNDVQFIMLMSEEEGARSHFDFLHCTPWYDLNTNKLHISIDQYKAITLCELIPILPFDKIKINRLQKFMKKGWHIDPDIQKQIEDTYALSSATQIIDASESEWED